MSQLTSWRIPSDDALNVWLHSSKSSLAAAVTLRQTCRHSSSTSAIVFSSGDRRAGEAQACTVVDFEVDGRTSPRRSRCREVGAWDVGIRAEGRKEEGDL